ncbi:hypothetical protein ACNKU7_12395 [Microbulbifer sp. SA54]|uniref:hypothetical protein n=1 Tax=Microbulbifer sp. SA54 TaxID=3401577 RepID=UPI003AACC461
MKIIKTLMIATIGLSPLSHSEEDREPLRTMSDCLIMHNWSSWGMWRFDVYALASEKILIGDSNNYFLVTSSEPGYKHVVAGETVAHFKDAESLKELGAECKENCPVNYKKRTGWFKRRCSSFKP